MESRATVGRPAAPPLASQRLAWSRALRTPWRSWRWRLSRAERVLTHPPHPLLDLQRDDLERLKKIRAHRGLRHYWGLTVRGQHTKTTGRAGKTVGVAKKR